MWVLKAVWYGLTVPVSSCSVNQILKYCIVEADLSLTAVVAGDTRYNLKSIVVSEKNDLLTPEQCFT